MAADGEVATKCPRGGQALTHHVHERSQAAVSSFSLVLGRTPSHTQQPVLQVEPQSGGCGLCRGGVPWVALHLEMTTSFQSARKVDYRRFIITAAPFIYMPAAPWGSTARGA